MGYVTRFDGEIAITPPIPWRNFKDSPFHPDNAKQHRDGRDLMFDITLEERENDEGDWVVVRRAVGLVSTWEDEARGYNIVAHLQEAIDAYPGHEFTGRLDCEGEETGDLWRLEVHDRKAVKVQPRIIWPDGTETRPR